MDLESLKYPIGKFKGQPSYSSEYLADRISDIKQLPEQLLMIVKDLSEEQLNTPYRPGGWSVRQLIHHVADSHMNAYIRFRWAMTEDEPLIKAYDEKTWADLSDANNAPVSLSLDLLRPLHGRWVFLLESMDSNDFARTLGHPDWERRLSLSLMTDLYAWHGKHHLNHVSNLIKRESW